MNSGKSRVQTEEQRYILVRRQRRYRFRRMGEFLLFLVFGLMLGTVSGYQLGFLANKKVAQEAEHLESELQSKGSQVESMRGELAVHKHGNEVERQVSEHLRQQMVEQQNQILEQEQTIAFYKSILEPQNTQALSIHTLELKSTPAPGRYVFKVVLVQPLDSPKEIAGTLAMQVSGLQAGKKQQLEWRAIANEMPPIPFKFKVYQDLTGELVLPESFLPEAVSVVLTTQGKKGSEVKDYPWKLKEAS